MAEGSVVKKKALYEKILKIICRFVHNVVNLRYNWQNMLIKQELSSAITSSLLR